MDPISPRHLQVPDNGVEDPPLPVAEGFKDDPLTKSPKFVCDCLIAKAYVPTIPADNPAVVDPTCDVVIVDTVAALPEILV